MNDHPYHFVTSEFELQRSGDVYLLKIRGQRHELNRDDLQQLYRIIEAGAVFEYGRKALDD